MTKYYNNVPARIAMTAQAIPPAIIPKRAPKITAKQARIASHNAQIWRTIRFILIAVPLFLILSLTGSGRGNGDR